MLSQGDPGFNRKERNEKYGSTLFCTVADIQWPGDSGDCRAGNTAVLRCLSVRCEVYGFFTEKRAAVSAADAQGNSVSGDFAVGDSQGEFCGYQDYPDAWTGTFTAAVSFPCAAQN